MYSHHSFYSPCLDTLTTSLRPHPAAEGNVLSVPRARCGGSTNAADARRLLHWPELAPESESETEPSLSCGSIPHHAGGGSTGAPLYSNGLSNIEARRRGHGAPLVSHTIETLIASAVVLLLASPPICSRSPLLSLRRLSADSNSSLLTSARSISASISCSRVETIGTGRSWHE